MKEEKNPCFKCNEREPGCHGKCENYIIWKNRHDYLRDLIYEEKLKAGKRWPTSIENAIKRNGEK